MVGYDELRAEQAARRARGDRTYLGIGISSYVEMCGLAPSRLLGQLNFGAGGWEHATVRFLPTGMVEVVTGTSPHGQGHETSWSMIAADCLGVPPEDVEVLHSDTAISHLGLDTYGSRSLSVGGMALYSACGKIVEKARAIAAHELEVAEADLEFVDGRVPGAGHAEQGVLDQGGGVQRVHRAQPAGGDGAEPHVGRVVRPHELHVPVRRAHRGRRDRRGDRLRRAAALRRRRRLRQRRSTRSSSRARSTGASSRASRRRCGRKPVYDESGNLRTASLTDYLVPSAAEAPHMELDSTVTPSPTTAMGVKGIGEAGTIGSTPAVMNAVIDALSPLGIRDIAMPASPERVWTAITEASR